MIFTLSIYSSLRTKQQLLKIWGFHRSWMILSAEIIIASIIKLHVHNQILEGTLSATPEIARPNYSVRYGNTC